ncbi:MAG: type II toxin-antitoxin system PemK/MazF family toxin [Candidatus Lokiarchaeota archaeon]
MKGKIVLLPFPFTNLTSTKRRPALVLLERPNDVVVAFISSIIPKTIKDHHVFLDKNHNSFSITGLKVSSTIYLDKIATIDKKLIIGELGQISNDVKREVNKRIQKLYTL